MYGEHCLALARQNTAEEGASASLSSCCRVCPTSDLPTPLRTPRMPTSAVVARAASCGPYRSARQTFSTPCCSSLRSPTGVKFRKTLPVSCCIHACMTPCCLSLRSSTGVKLRKTLNARVMLHTCMHACDVHSTHVVSSPPVMSFNPCNFSPQHTHIPTSLSQKTKVAVPKRANLIFVKRGRLLF